MVSTGVSSDQDGFPVVEIVGAPSATFYKVREMLYRNATCI